VAFVLPDGNQVKQVDLELAAKVIQSFETPTNKERIEDLISKQRTTLAEVTYLDLNSAAKVVQSFDTPTHSSTYEGSEQSPATERYRLGDCGSFGL
jgi:hypothetical protein